VDFPEKSKKDEAIEGMRLFRMMSSSRETNWMKTLMESFNRFHVRQTAKILEEGMGERDGFGLVLPWAYVLLWGLGIGP